jgi:Mn-dependent DtxR family transcriptional regulator
LLKTKNSFEEKLIEANTQEIAEDLEISRRTVQRALVKLQQENLIDLVIDQFKYRITSKSISTEDKSEMATPTSSGDTEII